MIEVDLARLFADSAAGKMKPASAYERVCGALPPGMSESGGFGLDADEKLAYIGVRGGDTGQHLPPGAKVITEAPKLPGSRMGAGPAGLRSMNLETGEIKVIIDTPFQMGHVQTNPWVPGEIVYCWETGGDAPQRTWIVMADGSGSRPLYVENANEWVTHEAVVTRDEVMYAIMGHLPELRLHPTGLAVSNLRTGQMRIFGQTPEGSGLWHVNGSPDGRWAVGDDFARNIYLIDRHNGEMLLLSTGHKESAADHPHPTFSADSTRILIQSALAAPDNRALDLIVIPVPKTWLSREYTLKASK
jgi:oligogalacturonide lyase